MRRGWSGDLEREFWAWRRYTTNLVEPVVAMAVATAVLSRNELSQELRHSRSRHLCDERAPV